MRTLAAAAMIAVTMSACSVVDTFSVQQAKVQPRQASGTYYLAKHLVKVVVDKITDNKTNKVTYNIAATTVAVPDARQSFEVGFALSPFSDDDIKVDYVNGLLSKVWSVNVDRTSDVLIELARAAGRLRQGAVTTITATTTTVSKPFSFDPFDPAMALAVNRQIQQAAGNSATCVEVEIQPGRWSPGCPSKLSMTASTVDEGKDYAPNFEVKSLARKPGIYFRRGVPRTVHVVLAGNHMETSQMLFSNNAPVYRVDVKRSAFVRRETVVTFTDGELTNVSVKKDSEALAIAKLPVAIVDAYVGGVVDAFVQGKSLQDARANYYNSLAGRIRADANVTTAKQERDKTECLAAHPIDTAECD